MSIITLICLVNGDTTWDAFCVKISRDESIGELKKAIKTEKQNEFAGVDANELKVWNVQISCDQEDKLKNLSLLDSDRLSAVAKISEYFPDSPAENCIHVIVEPEEENDSAK